MAGTSAGWRILLVARIRRAVANLSKVGEMSRRYVGALAKQKWHDYAALETFAQE